MRRRAAKLLARMEARKVELLEMEPPPESSMMQTPLGKSTTLLRRHLARNNTEGIGLAISLSNLVSCRIGRCAGRILHAEQVGALLSSLVCSLSGEI